MTLEVLHGRVAARADSVSGSCEDWPCRAGCDACCRSLADIPRMTRAEWLLLRDRLAALPEIHSKIEALENAQRPIQCPMLDEESGHCLVYEARPIACRTYGFYRDRDQGLYCGIIRERVDGGELDHVVWGNQAAIEEAQRQLGPEQDLLTWFRYEMLP